MKKTSRLHVLLLSGLLCFTAAARGQFTGSYVITDSGSHPAGSYAITPTKTSVTFGSWSAYTFTTGHLDTTNAASSSIALNDGSPTSTIPETHTRITATAATDINVSFVFNATASSGGFTAEYASFNYTTDGWATKTFVDGVTHTFVNNGTLGPVSVNFTVAAGHQFGLEVDVNNNGGGNTGMNAVVSNFSVSAIPEPSTYAALAGLAAILFT